MAPRRRYRCSRGSLAALALVIGVGLGATGCSAAETSTPVDPAPSASSTDPGAAETPAAARLEALTAEETAVFAAARSAIREQPGLEVAFDVTESGASAITGSAEVSGDLLSWRGSFLVGAFALDLVQLGDTLWVRGPDAYWASYGADAATIAQIDGKYLVFTGTEAQRMVAFADLTSFLQALESSREAAAPERVVTGEHAGMLAVSVAGQEQRFALDAEAPWIDRVEADLGAQVTSLVTLDPLPAAPRITRPDAADVSSVRLPLAAEQ